MPSIERTAYPRFNKTFTESELEQLFQPTKDELDFARDKTGKASHYLTLVALLKGQQYLGYFPAMADIPKQVQDYLRSQLGLLPIVEFLEENERTKKPFYLFRQAIRIFLIITPYTEGGEAVASQQIEASADTMSDPADLINVVLEKLIQQRYELPAFSTLDRLVGRIRKEVHEKIYAQIASFLTQEQCQRLDALLMVKENERISDFTRLKQNPEKLSLKQMNLWSKHLDWAHSIIHTDNLLKDIAYTKVRQFAAEAKAFEIGDIRAIASKERLYTLLICFIHQVQVQTRDQLVHMFLKRMRRTHSVGKEKLQELQEKYRSIEEEIMATMVMIDN